MQSNKRSNSDISAHSVIMAYYTRLLFPVASIHLKLFCTGTSHFLEYSVTNYFYAIIPCILCWMRALMHATEDHANLECIYI